MDLESGKQQFIIAAKKYQYFLLILLIGIALMLLPEKTKPPQEKAPPEAIQTTDLETELSKILSHITGVGTAKVLLTEDSGSNTIYQVDHTQNQSNVNTVILMDGNRQEQGLIKQIHAPVYRGAIVVCQGADNAQVRLSVVDAVKSVTGLSSDCITVLKMK